LIKKLKKLLSKRDKHFLLGLFIFSIIISIVEVVGVSAILPLISIVTDFSLINSNKYFAYAFEVFNFDSEISFIVAFGAILVIFYILRGFINLLYFHLLARFTNGRMQILQFKLFHKYMGMAYVNFENKNTSALTKVLTHEAENLAKLIASALFLISEFFIFIFIYALMLYVNYQITLALTIFLALNGLLVLKKISRKIKKIGIYRDTTQKFYFEIINRGFRNFKLIKLKSNNSDIYKDFLDTSLSFSRLNTTYETIGIIPRVFLESFAFSMTISMILYLVWQQASDVSSILPVISMFVLALYRLMPSINRIVTNYHIIQFNYQALNIIHNDLMIETENLGDQEVEFKSNILLKGVVFEYEKNKLILDKVDLKINKGSKVGFIGRSGSGKSTLIDLIVGLYKPISGEIFSDSTILDDSNIKSWRSKFGYIPQSVFLFDGTVGDNVVSGLEFNKEKVEISLKKAKVFDFLEKKNGINTLVGDGGVLLSGGQKQRIAIARALYSDPEVLILDEATSALDYGIEKEIMDEIYALSSDMTLIVVAHRISTTDRCDKVYEIKDGCLKSYKK